MLHGVGHLSPESVVLDNCWDLIPQRNCIGIGSFEELSYGTDSNLALPSFGHRRGY